MRVAGPPGGWSRPERGQGFHHIDGFPFGDKDVDGGAVRTPPFYRDAMTGFAPNAHRRELHKYRSLHRGLWRRGAGGSGLTTGLDPFFERLMPEPKRFRKSCHPMLARQLRSPRPQRLWDGLTPQPSLPPCLKRLLQLKNLNISVVFNGLCYRPASWVWGNSLKHS